MGYSLNELNNKLTKLILIMNKQEIYVSVERKEQAEIFRKVLEAMGEPISPIFYRGGEVGMWFSTDHWTCFEDSPCKIDEKKITFGELIDLLQRKPLIISEDGLPIYEGDIYYVPQRGGEIEGNGYSGVICDFIASSLTIRENDKSKRFIKRKKALKWIEAQKSKSIIVELFTLEVNAICTSDKVIIKDVDEEFSVVISKEKLAEINKAMEELKNV